MKRIKLNNIERNNLSKREMDNTKGGGWTCSCSCYYAGTEGGSSIESNGEVNLSVPGGLDSEKGKTQWTGMVMTP